MARGSDLLGCGPRRARLAVEMCFLAVVGGMELRARKLAWDGQS